MFQQFQDICKECKIGVNQLSAGTVCIYIPVIHSEGLNRGFYAKKLNFCN